MIRLADSAAFVLDLDGTLIDSEKYHRQALREALRELAGYVLTPQDEREFVGNTSFSLATRIARREGLAVDPAVVARRQEELLGSLFRAELFPFAGEVVRHWASRLPLALASNSPAWFVHRALRETGLAPCFRTVVTVDDVVRRKPAPDMILRCLDGLGTAAPRTTVFDDSEVGLAAALAAGCPAVLVDNGRVGLPVVVPEGVRVATWSALAAGVVA
ncbi:MAG: HAD family phosphatase [Lentisphaeria bacterium]|nr:HAD family phosphatase [Lentisphaeria bacterium]